MEPWTPDDEDRYDCPTPGPAAEKVPTTEYKPEPFLTERWNRVFKSPFIICSNSDQLGRVVEIHNLVIMLAAEMLKSCPNSNELDRALAALHEAQSWALTAVQANE